MYHEWINAKRILIEILYECFEMNIVHTRTEHTVLIHIILCSFFSSLFYYFARFRRECDTFARLIFGLINGLVCLCLCAWGNEIWVSKSYFRFYFVVFNPTWWFLVKMNWKIIGVLHLVRWPNGVAKHAHTVDPARGGAFWVWVRWK